MAGGGTATNPAQRLGGNVVKGRARTSKVSRNTKPSSRNTTPRGGLEVDRCEYLERARNPLPRDRRLGEVLRLASSVLKETRSGERSAVEAPPDHERPVGTMPETAQQH